METELEFKIETTKTNEGEKKATHTLTLKQETTNQKNQNKNLILHPSV